jgi:hypothetical protein
MSASRIAWQGFAKQAPRMGPSDAKQLRALEVENGQPKKLLAERMLENGSEFTSMAILKWVQDTG